MKAYFHKSFTLQRDNIYSLLEYVRDHPSATRHEIAVETGIGIGKNISDGKVRPTIQYAVYSGLLHPKAADSQNPIIFSDVGNIVFTFDPRLKSSVSQWVMHYFLSRPQSEAQIWSFFAHDFLPTHSEFESQTLEDELGLRFPNLSPRINKENRRVLTSCYTDGNALSRIKLLESFQKHHYIRGASTRSAFVAAYIFAEIWEAEYGHDVAMIEPHVLLQPGHFATTMNLVEGELQGSLDEMTAIGVINQMREAPPFQVVRKWADKFDLLNKAYEAD